jgi:superfamily II DNA/RNA helicase
MQYRFVELVKAEFKLLRVDLINGDTPIPQRQAIVNRFQRHMTDDQGFDLLVLGPKAAGMGLTLTAATHVIHLSRWWDPAVEEQCNDCVHRIGQTRAITIHIPMATTHSDSLKRRRRDWIRSADSSSIGFTHPPRAQTATFVKTTMLAFCKSPTNSRNHVDRLRHNSPLQLAS